MVVSMRKINQYAAMPTNAMSHPGVFKTMLEDSGFTDIVVRDYSENIKPMTRLFYLVAYIPWLIITLLGLERFFINTVAGVASFRGHGHWRYVAISATKPGRPIESPIDIIDHHLVKANRNIARSGLPPGQVETQYRNPKGGHVVARGP